MLILAFMEPVNSLWQVLNALVPTMSRERN
jgi:hypothetical protein